MYQQSDINKSITYTKFPRHENCSNIKKSAFDWLALFHTAHQNLAHKMKEFPQ